MFSLQLAKIVSDEPSREITIWINETIFICILTISSKDVEHEFRDYRYKIRLPPPLKKLLER